MSTAFLLLAAVKAALLLGLALVFCAAARRSSAAQRHLVLISALAGALFLPLLMTALPQLIVLPEFGMREAAGGGGSFPVIPAIWLAGVALLGMRSARRLIRVRRVLARGSEVRDARVLSAAIRARREVGARMPIRILTGPDFKVPMTTGVLKPTLLLPEGALRWSSSRLMAILLHETAHLARRDALTGVVAGAACAMWWFLPLSWWVARRLRLEREVACDDRVIERGAWCSGYAALLLDCFGRFRSERPTLAGAAVLSSRRELEGRVRSLVDARTNRRAPRRMGIALALAAALMTLTLATAGSATPSESSGKCRHCGRAHADSVSSAYAFVHVEASSRNR